MKKLNQGFTLVEIMIVVAIIAILAAVAIPNFVKYRQTSQATACVSNLKQIQSATEQVLMASKTPSAATLYGTDGYIKVTPTCPAKGSYTFSSDGKEDPKCSIGKTLDASDSSAWHLIDKTAE